MHILILNRYDPYNVRAGGAERFSGEIMSRFVKAGHVVTWISSKPKEFREASIEDGINYIRKGNRLSVIWHALRYYLKNKSSIDIVIDEIHALQFFTPLYVDKAKRVTLIHEVAGKIWLYMLPFPLSIIGLVMEQLVLRFIYRNERILTVSKSTAEELIKLGISEKNIAIVPEGTDQPIIPSNLQKTKYPSIVYFGGLRPLKRVEDQLRAVSILRKKYPFIKYRVLGKTEGKYFKKIQKFVNKNHLKDNVQFLGYLSEQEKNNIVAESWVTLSTSIKEGWGLAVLESAALGVPAVVYPVAGSVDAVIHYQTGLHTIDESPEKLALAISRIFEDDKLRDNMGSSAKSFANKLTWDNSYKFVNKQLQKWIRS